MADLSERELWARDKIEEREKELSKKDEELKAVQAKIEKELEKPQYELNAELLANWKEARDILRQQWTSLDTELQGFQRLLAAGGMCVFVSYAVNCASPPVLRFGGRRMTLWFWRIYPKTLSCTRCRLVRRAA